MAIIPSKQLHRAGPIEDLEQNLSDREIGYCTDDGILYIKYGNLVPIGVAVTSGTGIHVDTNNGQAVVSLTERNTYTTANNQVATGAIAITAGAPGTTHGKVSLGNADNIGALMPIPASNSNGKVLMVTSPNGETTWTDLPKDSVSGQFGIDSTDTTYILIDSNNLQIKAGTDPIRSIISLIGIDFFINPTDSENEWLAGATDCTLVCIGTASSDGTAENTVHVTTSSGPTTIDSSLIHTQLIFYTDESAPATFDATIKAYLYFVKSGIKYFAELSMIHKSYGSHNSCVSFGTGKVQILNNMT